MWPESEQRSELTVSATQVGDNRAWRFSPNPTLESAIAEIFTRFPPRLPDGTERVERLLHDLGDPHLRLPFVFHVAGTNGKGSTLAFLQAVFEAAGKTVHKFTGPHLVEFSERIVINGQNISDEELLFLIDEVSCVNENKDITFFEFFTALSLLAFSRRPADVILLETGVGGLLDATNVVEDNLIAIITRIDFDHMRLLGDTLEAIALHKAGIMRALCPVITDPLQLEGVRDILKLKAAETTARFDDDWKVEEIENGFRFTCDKGVFDLPLPALAGVHQMRNAGLALAALAQSPFRHLLDLSILSEAMRRVRWAGRLEVLPEGKLTRHLPEGVEIWIDGAHNPAGANTLAVSIARWPDKKPLYIVTSLKSGKDASGFFPPLIPLATKIYVLDTAPYLAMMLPADILAAEIRQCGARDVEIVTDLETLLHSPAFHSAKPCRILVTGSLYLIGHILKINRFS